MGDRPGASIAFLGAGLTFLGAGLLAATALGLVDLATLAGPPVSERVGDVATYGLGAAFAVLGLRVLRVAAARARDAHPKPALQFFAAKAEEARIAAKDLPPVHGPALPALAPLTARETELHVLSEKIRDMERLIQKANVKFGTGELSREGYSAYVERVRKDKAVLEVERQRLASEDADRRLAAPG